MNKSYTALVVSLVVCLSAVQLNGDMFGNKTGDELLKQELIYYKQAAALNNILFREGIPVHVDIVVSMLKEIDHNIAIYYPKGPFTRNDFIALGWVESEFRQFEVGTHCEKGIFQIMPDEFHHFDIHKNYYNVDINTLMAFRVLDSKYKKHNDYKLAIMAYNGLVKGKNGHYSQKYWKAFEKRKLAIDLVLNNI